MHTCPENVVATGRTVVYYGQAVHAVGFIFTCFYLSSIVNHEFRSVRFRSARFASVRVFLYINDSAANL